MEKKTLGIFAFVMVAIIAIGAVSAFGGFGNKMFNEDREAMATAVESGDYDSWADLKRTQISEDKFNEARTRHAERAEFRVLMQEARDAGDYGRIQDLRAEFGVGNGMNRKNAHSETCPFGNQ